MQKSPIKILWLISLTFTCNEKLKNLKTVCGVPRTGYTKKTGKFENIENAFLGVGRT
jgi:hypothetical protein